MWSLAPIVPIGALAITTIVYLTPGVDKLPALAAPLIGVALALIVFGLAVFLATRGAAEDRSVRTLGEIRLRLAVAEERLSSARRRRRWSPRSSAIDSASWARASPTPMRFALPRRRRLPSSIRTGRRP
jgi:hypothetical protein